MPPLSTPQGKRGTEAAQAPTDLEALRSSAIALANRTGELADIEKAAAISKSIAEERKATNELSNAERSFHATRLQSLLSAMLTIISVLGLIGTSVYNIGQLQNARSQEETTEWRNLLASIEKSSERPDGISDDITIPFRLRSFATSPRYRRDAQLMAAIVMSRMADPERFEQLFGFIFSQQETGDITIMAEIAREQTFSFNRVNSACVAVSNSKNYNFSDVTMKNICWDGYTDKQALDFGLNNDDKDTWKLRKEFGALGSQMFFISTKMAESLKSYKPGENTVPLRDLHIKHVSLENVDFGNIDISGTFFDTVKLSGAILNPKGFSGVLFAQSDWWNARTADPALLTYMITYFYPKGSEHYNTYMRRPSSGEYIQQVTALCGRSQLDCTNLRLNFEEDGTGSGVK